jgi:triosephosphate isomerase
MRGIEREADLASLSVGCCVGHTDRSNSPRSLVASKFERIVESSITLVRCVNAESAELKNHSIVTRKQVMAISERFA